MSILEKLYAVGGKKRTNPNATRKRKRFQLICCPQTSTVNIVRFIFFLSNYPHLFSAMMLSDQPDHVSCDEQKRKCRKRRKRQRKTQDSSNRGSRKKCRCRRRRGIQRSPYTTQASLGFLAPLDRRNQADNANERYQQPPVQSSCLHYLIDHCSLPSCSKKCPKNYDSFSGHPIKFEQMLRNAGVKGHDPIRQIFS